MEWYILFLLICMGLLIFLFLGVPVAFSLGLVGFFGLWAFASLDVAINTVTIVLYKAPQNFVLLAIPLYILVAEILISGDVGSVIYDGLSKVWSGLPGGLALSSIAMGVVVAAATGSSSASLGVIAPMAIEEMSDRGYVKWLSAGCLAGAGGLAIIIPPSITLIVYGFIAEVSIVKLFMAGLIPGLLMGLFYFIFTLSLARLRPHLAPASASLPLKARLRGLASVTPLILLAVFILTSIYFGIATPTEAAAIGVLCAFVIVLAYRKFSWSGLVKGLLETAKTGGFILLIIVAALIFAFLLSYMRVPMHFVEAVVRLGLGPTPLLSMVLVLFIVLGMFMNVLSAMVVAVPIVLPVLTGAGVDPIWLGVVISITLEIGLTSPPVGMNLFVLQGIASRYDISYNEIVKGGLPYIFCDLLALATVIAFPVVALWIPSTVR